MFRLIPCWKRRLSFLSLKSLNHKDQASTAIYARLDLDPVRQSVDQATSAMIEAAGIKPSVAVIALPELQAQAPKRERGAA